MCRVKKTRKDLNVPEWVQKEYQKRNKAEMAQMFMNCNWDKAGLTSSEKTAEGFIIFFADKPLKRGKLMRILFPWKIESPNDDIQTVVIHAYVYIYSSWLIRVCNP